MQIVNLMTPDPITIDQRETLSKAVISGVCQWWMTGGSSVS
jgi:hypothetical protein